MPMTIVQRLTLSLACQVAVGTAIGVGMVAVFAPLTRKLPMVPRLIAESGVCLLAMAVGTAAGERVNDAVMELDVDALRDSVSRLAYRAADGVHRAVSV